jgi:hypothetical protein
VQLLVPGRQTPSPKQFMSQVPPGRQFLVPQLPQVLELGKVQGSEERSAAVQVEPPSAIPTGFAPPVEPNPTFPDAPSQLSAVIPTVGLAPSNVYTVLAPT